MQNNQETLLKVEHLCQYFGDVKAVDDVSFDIKKGEVFGLVGESGCGKTTTGRSIIKLYDITGGNVYFKGIRIAAGISQYKQAIEDAKLEYKEKAADATETEKKQLKEELDKVVAENRKAIQQARYDQKHCDKEYAEERVAAVKAEDIFLSWRSFRVRKRISLRRSIRMRCARRRIHVL